MMRRTFALMILILLLAVLYVGLVSPVFAAKGSYPGTNGKIAFTDIDPEQWDWEIFVMDNDGTDIQQLTHNEVSDGDPCWSPDGTMIAFRRDIEIWVMDADGSNEAQLTTPPSDHRDMSPAWSPDGSKIAFTRTDDAEMRDIYVIDADGPAGAGTPLITDGAEASWSPDGSEIAYAYGGTIYVANAGTGAQKRTLGQGGAPCWSPDGTKIVFEGSGMAIWVMNAADGSNRQKLSDPYKAEDHEPNWSPDGTRIIFERLGKSIWIMNADGTNEYDLTPNLRNTSSPDFQRLMSPTPSHVPVGGVAEPANKLTIAAPYLVFGLISAVVVAAVTPWKKRDD